MAKELVILVTCPPTEAETIAYPLVDEGLAACVNIVPGITSLFRYDGKFCREQEALLLIKSTDDLWSNLEKRIRELHRYEIPEIICVPIERGHKPYLDWLNSAVERNVTAGKRGVARSNTDADVSNSEAR